MSRKASQFQKRAMSLGYRGKEIFKPLNKGMDDKQKSKSYFNRHSNTIINRNGYWSYDYQITSKILIRRNVKNLIDIGCGNGGLATFIRKNLQCR